MSKLKRVEVNLFQSNGKSRNFTFKANHWTMDEREIHFYEKENDIIPMRSFMIGVGDTVEVLDTNSRSI